MIVCQVFMWFVIYSVLGWVWESAYCTAVERSWQNRGFLYGPACPIYGVGAVAGLLAWGAVTKGGFMPAWWQVFLVAMAGSAVLEYVTHWLLEQLFHAYWWDYSNMPLNLNGRICLPASTLFGLAGLLVAYVLYQPTIDLTASLSPLLIEVLALVLMAAMAADTAVTVSAITQFSEAASAINRGANEHMEKLVAGAVERGEAAAAEFAEKREAAATELAERREEAAQAIEDAKETFARERERFAEGLRDSRVGEMSAAVRSAARRMRGFAPRRDALPELPSADELSKLLDKVMKGL